MKKNRCLVLASVVAAFCCLFAGCQKKAASPVERVAAKLNPGGCYYEIYDCTKLPPQMKFLTARVRPALEPLFQNCALDLPMTLDEALEKIQEVIHIAGVDRIEACGQSSIVLYGSKDKEPYFFHNRVVLDTGLKKKLPAFLLPYAGEPITLEAFASSVPENATAFTGIMDWEKLYRGLNKHFPFPPQATGTIQTFAGCPPEEFFAGISGRITLINMSANPLHPVMALQMPDRENRLYLLIARMAMQDGESGEFTMPVPNFEGQELKFAKAENSLTLYLGKDTKELIEKQLAAGKTFAKRADFAKLTARLPQSATGYGFSDYTPFNPIGNDEIVTDNAQYTEISAYQISSSGTVWYFNGYTDCQAAVIKAFMAFIPSLQTFLAAVEPYNRLSENSRFDGDDDFEALTNDSPENLTKCSENLTAIYEICKAYQSKHDGKLPDAPGLTGLQEIVKDAPDAVSPQSLLCPSDAGSKPATQFGNLKYLNISYLYVGTLPESIPAEVRPLFTEVPGFCHKSSFGMLFADGHVERVEIPENVNSIEKLMSFLHTEKHYSEEALHILLERGQALDKMLSEELAKEWGFVE